MAEVDEAPSANNNNRHRIRGAHERTNHNNNNMTDANARGRSYNTRGRGPGIVARLRSRSASLSRAGRRSRHQEPDYDVDDTPTVSSAPAQVDDILERHQLALRMDMLSLLETRDKEITFWKNKALKLRKNMTALEKAVGESGASVTEHESQEASTSQHGGNAAKESEQKLLEDKVAILERELLERNAQVESLMGTMAAQEKTSEERVRLLENQLERLVEIQTKIGKQGNNSNYCCPKTIVSSVASTQAMSSPGSSPSDNDLSAFSEMEINNKADGADTDNGKANGAHPVDPTHEITALEQLLARVLAEKDKLSFENDNLRTVLSETVPVPYDIANENTAPPNDEVVFQTYQLSCRICEGHVYSGSTTKGLKKTAKEHFSMVWKVVQSTYGKEEETGSSAVGKDLGLITSWDFIGSPLAHHLAEHCKDMESEKEVRHWCKKNVKLEKVTGGVGVCHSASKLEKVPTAGDGCLSDPKTEVDLRASLVLETLMGKMAEHE